MATYRLNLCSYKLDSNKELRYLTIGPNKELGSSTPLFLGADILNDSHVSASNHCRIHTRYSKKGLATKVTFPEDVSITGVTNCTSGAWFYNVQGVFQVIFELVPRSTQLQVVKLLLELWQDDDRYQLLPERLHATLEELSLIREPFNLSPLQSELDQVQHVGMEAEVATCPENEELPPATASTSAPPWLHQIVDVSTPVAKLGRSTLWWCCHALINKMQALVDEGNPRARELRLARALLACLRLVRYEARIDRGDDVMLSFLEDVIARFDETTADPARLRDLSVNDEWGLTGRQNALLCTVAEWLGKRLNPFVDRIGTRADALRAERRCTRPPNVVIDRLFPECMQLLVGYWIGLYGTTPKTEPGESQTATEDPAVQRVEATSAGDDSRLHPRRADHSYSNNRREVTGNTSWPAAETGVAVTVPVKTRVDHSYSFAGCPVVATGGGSPTEGQSQYLPPVRDDHTYVAASPGEALAPGESPGRPRKDHTYVSTRKVPAVTAVAQSVASSSGGAIKEGPQPQAKRLKTSRSGSDTRKVVLDPGKYRVAQLNLEFLNRVCYSELTPLRA